jgi:hypothetical protein
VATVVQIAVEIDEKGAVQGFRQIGTEGTKLEGGLQKVGQRGNLVFTSMAKQQKRRTKPGSCSITRSGYRCRERLRTFSRNFPD